MLCFSCTRKHSFYTFIYIFHLQVGHIHAMPSNLKTLFGTVTQPGWNHSRQTSQLAIGLTSGPRHTQYMSKQTDFITLRLLLNDFLDISSLSKQSKRCGHIWFCTTCWVNGSMPQHKSYAIDMAKRPQSAPPTCGVTPITLMVILEHVLFSDLVIWQACLSTVPSSHGMVYIESKSSTLFPTQNLLDKHAQRPGAMEITWTKSWGIEFYCRLMAK